MEKFKSRKFLMALGAVLTALGAALSGTLPWNDAMNAIVAVVIGYGVVEGTRDVVKAYKDVVPTATPGLSPSNRQLLINRYVSIGGMKEDEAAAMIDGIFASLPKMG